MREEYKQSVKNVQVERHSNCIQLKRHANCIQPLDFQSLKLHLAGVDAVQQALALLSQKKAQLRAELGSAKDRLNVERIVTDHGYSLTQEIDALRASASDRSTKQ